MAAVDIDVFFNSVIVSVLTKKAPARINHTLPNGVIDNVDTAYYSYGGPAITDKGIMDLSVYANIPISNMSCQIKIYYGVTLPSGDDKIDPSYISGWTPDFTTTLNKGNFSYVESGNIKRYRASISSLIDADPAFATTPEGTNRSYLLSFAFTVDDGTDNSSATYYLVSNTEKAQPPDEGGNLVAHMRPDSTTATVTAGPNNVSYNGTVSYGSYNYNVDPVTLYDLTDQDDASNLTFYDWMKATICLTKETNVAPFCQGGHIFDVTSNPGVIRTLNRDNPYHERVYVALDKIQNGFEIIDDEGIAIRVDGLIDTHDKFIVALNTIDALYKKYVDPAGLFPGASAEDWFIEVAKRSSEYYNAIITGIQKVEDAIAGIKPPPIPDVETWIGFMPPDYDLPLPIVQRIPQAKYNNRFYNINSMEITWYMWGIILSDRQAYLYGDDLTPYDQWKAEYRSAKAFLDNLFVAYNQLYAQIVQAIDVVQKWATVANINFDRINVINGLLGNFDSLQAQLAIIAEIDDKLQQNNLVTRQFAQMVYDNIVIAALRDASLRRKLNNVVKVPLDELNELDTDIIAPVQRLQSVFYTLNRQQGQLGWGLSLREGSSNVGNNFNPASSKVLLSNTKEEIREYYDIYSKSELENTFISSIIGMVKYQARHPKEVAAQWPNLLLCDGTLVNKNTYNELYQYLSVKLNYSGTINSTSIIIDNAFDFTSVFFENSMVIIGDQIPYGTSIVSFDLPTRTLVLNKPCSATGNFEAETMNMWGARIDYTNPLLFNLPNLMNITPAIANWQNPQSSNAFGRTFKRDNRLSKVTMDNIPELPNANFYFNPHYPSGGNRGISGGTQQGFKVSDSQTLKIDATTFPRTLQKTSLTLYPFIVAYV